MLREVGHTGLRKRALDGAKEGNVNPIRRPVSGLFGTGADHQVRACAGRVQRAAV
ncbi:TolB-like translocation protein [Pseudomonas aeruginosa]|nr:TolB-like translocation protein [Pseudomonas paraeruginosa]RQF86495.1 TolB-like translocation protein [Pseudomonas aeruginosa]